MTAASPSRDPGRPAPAEDRKVTAGETDTPSPNARSDEAAPDRDGGAPATSPTHAQDETPRAAPSASTGSSAAAQSSERLRIVIASLTAVASILAALASWSAALAHADGVNGDRQATTELMRVVERRTATDVQISGNQHAYYMASRRLSGETELLSDPTRAAYARGAERAVRHLYSLPEHEQEGGRTFDLDAALLNALRPLEEPLSKVDPTTTMQCRREP